MNSGKSDGSQNIITRINFSFMRLFFKLLYHQFAWAYDFVAWFVSLGRWKQWVMSTLDYIDQDNRPVLELGPGTGRLQLALFNAGITTVGIDESKQMCRITASRLSKVGRRAMITRGITNHLPFPQNTFSSVVATFPTEYITNEDTLAEIQRVLIDHGSLIVVPVAMITGQSIFDRFAAWLFRVTGQAPKTKLSNHKSEIEQPFVRAGFKTQVNIHKFDSSEVITIVAKKPKESIII